MILAGLQVKEDEALEGWLLGTLEGLHEALVLPDVHSGRAGGAPLGVALVRPSSGVVVAEAGGTSLDSLANTGCCSFLLSSGRLQVLVVAVSIVEESKQNKILLKT